MSMVVVSNRLPFVLKRDPETGKLSRKASAGGLVTAMGPVVKEKRGIWIGWPGMELTEQDVIPDGDPTSDSPLEGLRAEQIVPVNVPPGEFDSYYNGCCNGAFWPLLHSMPDRAVFNREDWKSYTNVNCKFANTTFEALLHRINSAGEAPLVWIHDYHLMLMANQLRQDMEDNGIVCTIAFFLHIPFPSWDVFRLFPWDDEVLVGLLGCDLLGFHIEGYAENFLECCQKRLGCRVDRERMLVEHDGRTVRVGAFPIGIPFDRFEQLALEAQVETVDKKFKLVLGVDRLDYTKGIIHRVKAFGKLLEKYPEHKEEVLMLQVAVPSRTDVPEYQALKDELEREIGRINGRFSSTTWSPIRYIYRFMAQEELCAFYRDAAVALVTPIRDGMNLVAKEFVACQIAEPKGVLVLSPFTGAGETMSEALIANPLEEFNLADTIHRALTMSEDERELRMSALRRREREFDITHWLNSFLAATGTLGNSVQEKLEPLTIAHFEKWLASYVGSRSKLALLLDYDGTLAPIAAHPNQALLPNKTKTVLQSIAKMPNVYVAVISGRDVNNVKAMVNIDGITYAGNHGLDILHPDGTKFIHPEQVQYLSQVSMLEKAVEPFCTDGAWVEKKGVVLTYHYRNVPKDKRGSLVDEAMAVMLRHGFDSKIVHCAIEARPPINWDKGRACIQVLRSTFGIDWSERVRIIYVGDDTTDEDAMRALAGMAKTFRVANTTTVHTNATHRLHDTSSVLTLLQWVEGHVKKRLQNQEKVMED